ncbi:tripartite motif-containing protein 15-like isoform X2 [Terrapene carolina triunguis]|uniref:tripartite motif-containing protein 15-like isoform X2 n=1 Tax=Terrapene triunguis TaxID=2587831 RepID=UPI001156A959|nr:tripartite motif-containing protein 15-like isoform X2 [Terrapene carolina triunguis]
MSEFEQLHQFLREQERLLLARLAELDQEIVKLQDENVIKLSKEISRLSEQISELEGKCRQPASEFLQDIRSTMSRSEEGKFQQLLEASSELERSLSNFCQKNIAVKLTLNKLKVASARCPRGNEQNRCSAIGTEDRKGEIHGIR